MSVITLRGKRYDTGESVEIVVRNGRIASLRSPHSVPAAGASREQGAPSGVAESGKSGESSSRILKAEFIAPGFCDIQVNGALGHNFTSGDLTVEQVRAVTEVCQRHGTTAYCPTVITGDRATLTAALRGLAQAVEQDATIRQAVVGFHLEGPYICPAPGPRGAHPAEHIRPPNREEFRLFQDAAAGRIRLVTLSPHWPGVCDFIAWLVEQGIVVALGHHQASTEQIRDAIRAGARLATHLGNGCDLVLPRHPNYLWDQLAADELWASLIADGHHLPPAVIRCILRCKTLQQALLISDASPLAGLSPGRYRLWSTTVEVTPSGRAVVVEERGGSVLAGACSFLDTCIFRAWQDGGISLADAVRLAVVQPRALLGLPTPAFTIGEAANFVLFDIGSDRLCVRYTVVGEQVVAAAEVVPAHANRQRPASPT